MKCPKCGSTYVDVKDVDELMDSTRSRCICSGCNNRFEDHKKRRMPDGELVMELLGRTNAIGCNEPKEIVR